LLSSPVVSLIPNIAFPQSKHLTNEVVFEEVHTGKNIEKSRLVHPLGQSKELRGYLLYTSILFHSWVDVNNTLSTDGEIFTLLGLWIVHIFFLSWYFNQIVRPELGSSDWLPTALNELDRSR
jgi:hypothetical protein